MDKYEQPVDRKLTISYSQNIEKAFKSMGYATQVKTLSDFHDDYGLPGGDEDGKNDPGEDDEEDDSEEDDDMSEEEDALMDGAEDLSDFDGMEE